MLEVPVQHQTQLRTAEAAASADSRSSGGMRALHVVQVQRPVRVFNEQVPVLGGLVKEIFVFKIIEVPRCAVTYDVQGMGKGGLGAAGNGGRRRRDWNWGRMRESLRKKV